MLSSFKHYKTLLPPDVARYDTISESGNGWTTFQLYQPAGRDIVYHFFTSTIA
jgi:hypothetical protein